jgi:hypothetical protein
MAEVAKPFTLVFCILSLYGVFYTSTLPVQMFCWASSLMLVLFLVSEYLESSCVFYRDIRFYAGM